MYGDRNMGFGYWLCVAAVYASFFSVIGFACWLTGSASPLWALLIAPSFKFKLQ